MIDGSLACKAWSGGGPEGSLASSSSEPDVDVFPAQFDGLAVKRSLFEPHDKLSDMEHVVDSCSACTKAACLPYGSAPMYACASRLSAKL
eukprot:CAMPEP_0169242738 /NCGR_PEP_ID=MMETSP1016-20121227/32707_1 /TAXON_ID=342587 /ORGANISM="Karlodinium micrum, Strain CCMP2283" /LENGTH=89 /DNA_ID=CAMNT_0009322963 /DNA_START=64 /DNA_END=334 /DNA_ORIENTATION=-